MMTNYFVFINTKDRKLLAVAPDREGGKLPQDQGGWQYWKEFKSGLSGRSAFGLTNPEEAYVSLNERGYYLWKWPTHIKAA